LAIADRCQSGFSIPPRAWDSAVGITRLPDPFGRVRALPRRGPPLSLHPPAPLRLRTWLAPSLPFALFEVLAERIAGYTGRPVALTSDPTWSGPRPWLADPVATGEVDIRALCAPSPAGLASRPLPSVVAVPALPVPTDPRAAGRPVYFSDVIVRADGPRHFSELRGTRWAYNDPCSLSGWFALKANVGDVTEFFAEVVQSGSHLASIRAVADGLADASAIDSTVLGRVLAADPELRQRLRILTSWGPHPIQPVVARAALGPEVIAAVGAALRTLGARELGAFGLAGFVDEAPAALDQALCA
jgi:hypothetical protein